MKLLLYVYLIHYKSSYQYISTGSGYGLVLSRQQASNWTSDYPVHWLYMHQISNIRCAKFQNLNVSRLAVVFVQYIEARC